MVLFSICCCYVWPIDDVVVLLLMLVFCCYGVAIYLLVLPAVFITFTVILFWRYYIWWWCWLRFDFVVLLLFTATTIVTCVRICYSPTLFVIVRVTDYSLRCCCCSPIDIYLFCTFIRCYLRWRSDHGDDCYVTVAIAITVLTVDVYYVCW